METAIQRLSVEIVTAEKVAAKRQQIEDEAAQLELGIIALRRRLPNEPGVEAFLGELAEAMRELSVEIKVLSTSELDRELYGEIQLEVALEGAPPDEGALKKALRGMDRLVGWGGLEKAESPVLALSIYHVPHEPISVSVKPCLVSGPNALGYLPFTPLVSARRAEAARLCEDRSKHEEALLFLERYQSSKEVWTLLKQIHDHLAQRERKYFE